MPARSGTVTDDIVTAVGEFHAGKIEFRADSAVNLHVRVGIMLLRAACRQHHY